MYLHTLAMFKRKYFALRRPRLKTKMSYLTLKELGRLEVLVQGPKSSFPSRTSHSHQAQNFRQPFTEFRQGDTHPFRPDLNFKLMLKERDQLRRGKFLISVKLLLSRCPHNHSHNAKQTQEHIVLVPRH